MSNVVTKHSGNGDASAFVATSAEHSVGQRAVADADYPDKMRVAVARRYLGIGQTKMSLLIDRGIVKTETDKLDKRAKLCRRAQLDEVRQMMEERKISI